MKIYVRSFQGKRLLANERCNCFKTAELRAEDAQGDKVFCVVTEAEANEIPLTFRKVKGVLKTYALQVRFPDTLSERLAAIAE